MKPRSAEATRFGTSRANATRCELVATKPDAISEGWQRGVATHLARVGDARSAAPATTRDELLRAIW